MFQQFRQPRGVGDIGLAARRDLAVAGVDQLEVEPAVFEHGEASLDRVRASSSDDGVLLYSEVQMGHSGRYEYGLGFRRALYAVGFPGQRRHGPSPE